MNKNGNIANIYVRCNTLVITAAITISLAVTVFGNDTQSRQTENHSPQLASAKNASIVQVKIGLSPASEAVNCTTERSHIQDERLISVFPCKSKIKKHDHLAFSVSTDLESRKKDVLYANNSNIHYKMEANLSVEHVFLEWRKDTQVYLGIMLNFIDSNMTFVFNYVNCTRRFQPIWMLPRPLCGPDGHREVAAFRHRLPKYLLEGKIVGNFSCSNSSLNIGGNEQLHVSKIRFRLDVDLTSKRLTLETCPPDDWQSINCNTAFNRTVKINTAQLDFRNIRTLFFGSWPGQHLMDLRTFAGDSSILTWCEEERKRTEHDTWPKKSRRHDDL
ncbi:uncharacterized protein LOC111262486 isoform X1 [Varroa jacobsoni]|uniref:uncharacterized protein LOC111262486 isoform X1 n=1 Tax=Varroa jacobsoni TaxID=62625 RepID=UPI000BF6FF77|nr:uncharacterized protein LOC111262486 isoform X1 [Varroa jacobsoni]